VNSVPGPQAVSKSFQNFLLVWAVVATLVAVVFAAVALLLFSRGQWAGARAEAFPLMTDFSKTNTVVIVLGEQEKGGGLKLVETEKDGLTTITNVNGVRCRELRPRDGRQGFVYFIIDPTFKDADATNVRVAVDYLDVSDGRFTMQYDASAHLKASNAIYTSTSKTVRLKGSETWKTAQFYLQNCSFANSQNGGGDFRIQATPPERLFLRRVTVTRKANEKPLVATNDLVAEVDSLSPIEQRQTQNNSVVTYSQELAPGEIVIGHARRFQGHSSCVAFLISGPGLFQFSVESGIYYKYNNVPREFEEALLQKQARVLADKYDCSPVQFVRVASAVGQ
jgi:hypothetical protein